MSLVLDGSAPDEKEKAYILNSDAEPRGSEIKGRKIKRHNSEQSNPGISASGSFKETLPNALMPPPSLPKTRISESEKSDIPPISKEGSRSSLERRSNSIKVPGSDKKWSELYEEAYGPTTTRVNEPSSYKNTYSSSVKEALPASPSSLKHEGPVQLKIMPQPVYTRYFQKLDAALSPSTSSPAASRLSKELSDSPVVPSPLGDSQDQSTRSSTSTKPPPTILSKSMPSPGMRFFRRNREFSFSDRSISVPLSGNNVLAHRPIETSSVYARSESRFSASRSGYTVHYSSDVPLRDDMPFSELSNSLKLYIELNVLKEDERILLWKPITYTEQLPPYIHEYKSELGVYVNVGDKPQFISASQLKRYGWKERPAYILLTSDRLLVYTPRFRIPPRSQQRKTEEKIIEQALEAVRYEDPSSKLELKYSFSFKSLVRIDVGPQGQYLTVHSMMRREDQKTDTFPNLSLVLLIRDVESTALIVETARAVQERLDLDNKIHDSVEWLLDAYCESLLLKRGPKKILINTDKPCDSALLRAREAEKIRRLKRADSSAVWKFLAFRSVFPTPTDESIEDEPLNIDFQIKEDTEDSLLKIPLRKPETIIKFYQLAASIIVDQVPSNPIVRPCSLLSSNEFLYLFTERFDVWPPLFFPPEATTHAANINEQAEKAWKQYARYQYAEKGYLCDVLPLLDDSSILKVIEVGKISRVEKWKTWRWSHEKIKQVEGTVASCADRIKRGIIGRCGTRIASLAREKLADDDLFRNCPASGTSTGWPWFVRIYYRGTIEEDCSWDVAFASFTEADRFIAHIKALLPENVEVVVGDD